MNHNLESLFDANPWPLIRHLGLQQVGGRVWCPFCQPTGAAGHRTPDMSMRKGVKCFRCGRHSSAVQFVMDVLRCDYKTARRQILSAYGITDDAPMKVDAAVSQAKAKRKYVRKSFACFEDAKLNTYKNGWTLAGVWWYNDRLCQTRWDTPHGKTYRPFYRSIEDDLWRNEAAPTPWPLYTSQQKASGPLVVVEGEKCVDAIRAIGLKGYTSLSGARGASRSDWSVLMKKTVLVIADNDDAGLDYAHDVKRILDRMLCRVRVKQMEGPSGYDVADFLLETKLSREEAVKEILK